MLFSFLSKYGTLYLVIIFCIIEYKNRCVRIKAPHICPDPRRHGIRVSPAAADTVPVLSSQQLCRILLTLFQNICGHGFFGWDARVYLLYVIPFYGRFPPMPAVFFPPPPLYLQGRHLLLLTMSSDASGGRLILCC